MSAWWGHPKPALARRRGLARHVASVAAGVAPWIGRGLGPVGAVLFTHPDLVDLDVFIGRFYPDDPTDPDPLRP